MNVLNVLKRKEERKTSARKAILDLLEEIKKPLVVSEIIKRLNKKGIKIDRATIFRNINLMVKENLINKIELNEGKFRYESSFLPHHHHIVCTKCNMIKDIKSDFLHKEIDNLSKKASKLYGFKMEDHKVEFFGRCRECKELSPSL